ncbi:MAG: hypothetical protein PVI57_02850 [Gemmatimonadota bacterium]|jgi:hypothetical protein
MRTRTLWLAVATPLLLLSACDPGSVELETRTFRLDHLEPHRAQRIIEPYVWADREGSPGLLTVTEGAVTVRETADNLERIAEVLYEFDRPRDELRLRFQVVEADGFQGSEPAIADVEEELRRLFRFEGYRLAGEGVVSVANESSFRQSLTGPGDDDWQVTVTGTVYRTGDSTRLQEVTLWGPEPLFETSVNVRPGQTLVLGSARAPDGRGAVILTVQVEPAG